MHVTWSQGVVRRNGRCLAYKKCAGIVTVHAKCENHLSTWSPTESEPCRHGSHPRHHVRSVQHKVQLGRLHRVFGMQHDVELVFLPFRERASLYHCTVRSGQELREYCWPSNRPMGQTLALPPPRVPRRSRWLESSLRTDFPTNFVPIQLR